MDVQDTPYKAHPCGGSVWAIRCVEHNIVFAVEITEEGPLFDVPWDPLSIENLPEDVREAIHFYAQHHGARVDEDGCIH